jgi:tryptophan 2,3-dioxygenase
MSEDMVVPTDSMLTYGSYLGIDALLDLQRTQSDPPQHDETLFIIIHQVYELWFKQILHETEGMARSLDADRPLAFIKVLKRVLRIFDVLIHQIDILETMTPNDFDRFRNLLNPASGFQSHQFRALEFRLGLKDPKYFEYQATNPAGMAALKDAFDKPTLYDRVLAFLARRGVDVPLELLDRDVSQAWVAHEGLAKEYAEIYLHPHDRAHSYTILELLLDFDQKLLLWRYRHVAMVERIIGITRGTGGSLGVEYLGTTMSKRCFPEIWDARAFIITRLDSPERDDTPPGVCPF